MDKSNRPLWQLLSLTWNSKEPISLTCEECFALLEYDADLLVAGARPAEIRTSVNHHLVLCSSCQTQIDGWLEKLEGDKKLLRHDPALRKDYNDKNFHNRYHSHH